MFHAKFYCPCMYTAGYIIPSTQEYNVYVHKLVFLSLVGLSNPLDMVYWRCFMTCLNVLACIQPELWSWAHNNIVCIHTILHAWTWLSILSHSLDKVYRCFMQNLNVLACILPEIWPWACKSLVCMHTSLRAWTWTSMMSHPLDMV